MEIIKDDKIYFGGATSPVKVGIKLSDADIKVDIKNIETGNTAKGKLLAADGEGKTEWVDARDGATYGLNYLTNAPTSANMDGGVKIVVLSAEPETKYDGYIYLITEA